MVLLDPLSLLPLRTADMVNIGLRKGISVFCVHETLYLATWQCALNFLSKSGMENVNPVQGLTHPVAAFAARDYTHTARAFVRVHDRGHRPVDMSKTCLKHRGFV
jgi:hypothetical protein